MSQKSGIRAESENGERLKAQGHKILFFSTKECADQEDVCCNTLVEVKTTIHKVKRLNAREQDQLRRLLEMQPWKTIRYDVKFIRIDGNKSAWMSFYPTEIVKSFKPTFSNSLANDKCKETVLKFNRNKKKTSVKEVGGAKK